jgi:hypothetical protein
MDFRLDWRVFAYASMIALASGLIVGIVPAIRASPENARFGVLGALGVLVVRFLKGNHQGAKNTKITKDQQRIAHFHRRWCVNGRMINSRTDLNEGLREGGRGQSGAGRLRMRDALVVAQLAGSLVLLGGVAGIAATLGLSRLLASMLFGIMAWDPLTYVVVTLVLAIVALAACYIPARRATRIDPIVALRHE